MGNSTMTGNRKRQQIKTIMMLPTIGTCDYRSRWLVWAGDASPCDVSRPTSRAVYNRSRRLRVLLFLYSVCP